MEPLYTLDDAEASINSFSSIGYDRSFQVAPGVTVTFRDAGHILGSAISVLDIEEDGHASPGWPSPGTWGARGWPSCSDPAVVQDVDYLLIESTYGDRLHDPVETTEKALRDVVVDTYNRGGKLIVPAFAVGRTQELVYALHRLTEQRDIPSLPIYVDSPLALNVTEVFRLHPECFDRELNEFLAGRKERDPFGFDGLSYIRTTRGIEGAELPAAAGYHYQRLGHVRGRAHPAPSQEQHRGRAQHHPHRRLAGARYPGAAAGGARAGGQDLWRGVLCPGPGRDDQRLQRPRRPHRPVGVCAADGDRPV